ncbi:MAG TPA: PP2C family protein-serine/threonine phosphatase [Bacillota bacterium]|nr:PP2C family protein-serine/threonine phosphatase [Bacillota bacterium]
MKIGDVAPIQPLGKAPLGQRDSPGAALPALLTDPRQTGLLPPRETTGLASSLVPALPPVSLNRPLLESGLLAQELDVARQIQQARLPKTFPKLPGFGLSGFCLSARQVGGDLYDVFALSQETVLLLVADVMGKGVPAALFASTLRALAHTLVEWTGRPAELLTRMNRLMFAELSAVDMFVTVQMVLVDLRQRQLTIANAGHCPLLLATPQQSTQAIVPEGLPLGIVSDTCFSEETLPLAPASCLLLYTDGLTEARNPQGDLFGQERLEAWLSHHAKQGLTAGQLKERFLSDLKRFQSDLSPRDDQTFLLLTEEPSQGAV